MVGRDAEAALSWICANDVAKPPGTLTYTQMLNARGGIECDLTVARLAEDVFYIVTGTGFATHDFHWIRRNIPAELDARLVDVTSQQRGAGADGAAGARRARGGDATTTSRTPASRSARAGGSSVAGAPVIALRITYVGELGWELHIPVEFAATRLRRADGGGRGRTASPMPATARSNRCGWRRSIAPGARRSARTTRR